MRSPATPVPEITGVGLLVNTGVVDDAGEPAVVVITGAAGATAGGLKLVGTLTLVTPGLDRTPVAGPRVAPAGITCPAFGTKLPPTIVPAIGVVEPAGRNDATVPLARLPPVRGIVGNGVPVVPAIGLATVGTDEPRVGQSVF